MTSDPGFFVRYAWLIPFFPLLGALVTAIGARRLKSAAHYPVWAGIGLAFLVSLGTLAAAGPDVKYTVMDWLSAGDLEVPIQVRVDGLSTMMLSMVTFVSGLVAIFAAGYMAGDPGYPRFFALIGLFVFSMTGLVLSNNYLLTYVFWEGVGACSYLLIGYWHSRPSAAAAAMKAFLVNRVGDFGFAVAIFWLWTVAPDHDLSYDNVFSAAHAGDASRMRRSSGSRSCSSGARRPRAPDPALRLAPRRHGRPDAGLGADPRGDDGHGRRLPDRPLDPDRRPGAGRAAPDRDHRMRHGAARGGDRRDPERPQAGDGLFHGQPARLHVHGPRRRRGRRGAARGDRGDVPPVHPRLLQGAAVPRLGQRDARDGRRDRHAAIRRAPASDADHLLDVRRRRPGPGGDPAALRLLQQGRDPGAPLRRAPRGARAWAGAGSTA